MIPLLTWLCTPLILWTVEEGLLVWMGSNGRYEEIHVTYKSTEKIVPVMKVSSPPPPICYI